MTTLRLPAALVCAAALQAGGAAAAAQDDGGFALHRLAVSEAELGNATLREQQTGARWWSRAHAFEHFTFRAAADYAYTRYEIGGLPTRDRDLHHLHLPLQWRARDAQWSFELTPVVATSSNVFKDLFARGGRDDFDLYGRWEVERWIAATRGWRLALVRDAAFGQPRFYPAAAFLWRSARIDAAIGLPSTQVDWKLRDDVALGLGVFPAGAQWHVVSDERGGAEFDFRARAWRGAVTASWQPWRRLRISGAVGIAFARHVEFEDDSGASIDRDAGSKPYYRIEVGWQF